MRSSLHRLCSLVVFFVATQSAWAAERPSIVLLMGDDHGWDETGYNGHPHLKTPVLDEMAAAGLHASNAPLLESLDDAVRIPGRGIQSTAGLQHARLQRLSSVIFSGPKMLKMSLQ